MNIIGNIIGKTALTLSMVLGTMFGSQAQENDESIKLSKGVKKETQEIVDQSGSGLKFKNVEKYVETSAFGGDNTKYALVYTNDDDSFSCLFGYTDANNNGELEPGEFTGFETKHSDGKNVIEQSVETRFPQFVSDNPSRWTEEAYKTLINVPIDSQATIKTSPIDSDDATVTQITNEKGYTALGLLNMARENLKQSSNATKTSISLKK